MMPSDNLVPIFIPSYHRPDNVLTAKYFVRQGWDPKKIFVVIDSEADDKALYEANCAALGVNLRVFDIEEGRKRFDFVHRASVSRRAAGLARNCFYEIAEADGISFYCVIDDDTDHFQIRPMAKYIRLANGEDIANVFAAVRDWMQKRHIGCWGLSQTGDLFEKWYFKLIRRKVMNTTFYDTRFIYRGERGVQDNDTSQFVGIMNEGYFTGSLGSGLILKQKPSATQAGGAYGLIPRVQAAEQVPHSSDSVPVLHTGREAGAEWWAVAPPDCVPVSGPLSPERRARQSGLGCLSGGREIHQRTQADGGRAL